MILLRMWLANSILPYTPDMSIPIIHGSLGRNYRGQGLYRRLILPTLIDYFGERGVPLGSGRYNRSQAQTNAYCFAEHE